MVIPDSHVEHALKILQSPDHARYRAAYEFSEKNLKTILASEIVKADAKSATERESLALSSEAYKKALEAFRVVAEAYFTAKDRRDAACAVIEAWRTASSNERAQGRIT